MATSKCTFIDVFNIPIESEEETIQIKKIVIPIIQRDYAQGRDDSDIRRVRSRFLESLYNAIIDRPTTLDFIYGDIDEHGIMTPLDGQQRLTTLFLLHWYVAKKENIPKEEYEFLKCFSYETRYSARSFCKLLVDFTPTFSKKISDEIINQSWFPLNWKKDPTIASMLVMLDAIDDVFNETENIWPQLKGGAITFFFLPIKKMGLTDEIYIKMNSRGKPLTQFEHFKAEFERELSFDNDVSSRIIKKIDIDWTEMLWRYRSSDNIIDDSFLKYFKYICDIICYKNGDSRKGKSYDEFDLLKEYFSKDSKNVRENIETLEKYFDCWNTLNDESPESFLNRILSHEHEVNKIKVDKRLKIDIFEDCLQNYAELRGRNRVFPLNRIIFLYAITCYLLHKNQVSEDQFIRRLRIVNNLIQNSEDEISDSETRSGGNRIPAILAQIDSIILFGTLDEKFDKGFNSIQIAEEKQKIKWLENNEDKAEALFTLEDHELLQGQIGIVGLDNHAYFSKFMELFNCDWDLANCALMSIDFYPQKEQNGWRYQFGSSENLDAWRTLFHRSTNQNYDKTHQALIKLLSQINLINNETLESLVETYIKECEDKKLFSWRYYFVKYPIFRSKAQGKYYNEHDEKESYLFYVMQTKQNISENSYIPFLKEADDVHLSREYRGKRLIYDTIYIECENAAYVIKDFNDDKEVDRVTISQEKGIDTENRIEKLKEYIKKYNTM